MGGYFPFNKYLAVFIRKAVYLEAPREAGGVEVLVCFLISISCPATIEAIPNKYT
jgi:hypothetical protein